MQQVCCYLVMEYQQMKNLLIVHYVQIFHYHVHHLLTPKIE
jgi:hypothetical protein